MDRRMRSGRKVKSIKLQHFKLDWWFHQAEDGFQIGCKKYEATMAFIQLDI